MEINLAIKMTYLQLETRIMQYIISTVQKHFN